MTRSNHVNILGAGQCGALLATMLSRRGMTVSLFERNDDPRGEFAAAGRSINLALSSRGINGLKQAGVLERIGPLLVPMRGRMVHDVDGSTEFLPYGQRENEQIYSASRGELNKLLLDAADAAGNVEIHFGHAATRYDPVAQRVHVLEIEGDHDFEIETNPVIAADGAGSVLRNALHESGTIRANEDMLAHGYKELLIPAGPDGAFQLESDALHIWPRGEFMLIALPNPGGDFTLTLFLPNEGETSFESLHSIEAAAKFMEEQFPDAVPLIDEPARSLVENPLGFLGTVRCDRWHDAGNVLLIGDAAHAVVPFHGQGMNLAFEDCVVLTRILDDSSADWDRVFSQYENEQHRNANAIADMALENYIEMRDTVRDPKFALQKALSFELERRLPGCFIPRYSMVMFHAEIPYSVAQQRGAVQQAVLEEFTRDAASLDQIDIDAAATAVTSKLKPIASI
jgi:kynurenine 3-monooxygenase